MNILKSGLKVFSAQSAGAILSFVGLVYFSRVLSPSELGVFFLFQALLGFAAIPANLGIRLAVEKRVSEGTDPNRYLGTGMAIKITLIIFVAIVLLAIRDHIAAYLGANLVIPLIIAVAFKELGDLMVGVIRGELRVGDTAVVNVSYQIGWVGFGALFTMLGYGLNGLVAAVISGYFLKFIWSLHRSGTAFGLPGRKYAWSLVTYGIYVIIPSVDDQMHNWMDIALLGVFLNPAAVAAYEVAWRVGNVFLILIQSISQTVFPQMSSWNEKNDIDQLEKLIPQAITPALLITIPATAGAWFLSGDILTIIFGEEYTMASVALVIIIAAKIPRSIQVIVGTGLLGTGRANQMSIAAISDIISNLVLNVILIQTFGILGAALGTGASLIIGTFIRWWFLSKYIHVSIDIEAVIWSIVGTSAMSLVLWTYLSIFSITHFPSLLITVFFGASVYFLTLLLNRRMRTQLHSITRSLSSAN